MGLKNIFLMTFRIRYGFNSVIVAEEAAVIGLKSTFNGILYLTKAREIVTRVNPLTTSHLFCDLNKFLISLKYKGNMS